MANPTPNTPPAKPAHSNLVRTIAIVLLALIVIAGLIILIIWLTVKPKKLIYTVEEASIRGYNLTNNHLNSTFNFVIRAYNPNTKVSIYYDRVEVSVSYDDQLVAFNSLDSFYQPRRTVTHLRPKLVAQ